MRLFLVIISSILLSNCSNSELKECGELNLDWTKLSDQYRVRFFKSYQFEEVHIEYYGKSCSDFLYTEKSWTDLNSEEISQLKTIILDSSNWVQGNYSDKADLGLFAGFTVFNKENCLVGKIDITEAANHYQFFPENIFTNKGDINFKGSCELDSLWDSVNLRAQENRYTNE
ncbi:hypothetical protein K6119_09895 [Paracrocinitomix mangrovi]|uniref:hypothetical protein n=1 Tax=Paracrocinitomix mangrovi TaxID=2862509 RepID=UPI001C8E83EE|nr:hypothetical protein [Paracrocinitomix mangrovi]UKN03802.1 hypothetical protein K6119_09895 [Paracrocinitomix mangrovi]